MKVFDRIFAVVLFAIALLFVAANVYLLREDNLPAGRPYRVEVNRMALEIQRNGFENLDLSEYTYVTKVERQEGQGSSFFETDTDYILREIDGELYRFEYSFSVQNHKTTILMGVNIILGSMSLLVIVLFIFIRKKLLLPFQKMTEIPYELAKGNLAVPVKESKSRFFGKFLWGVDMLRENMEAQKQRELELQKEKKTLLLSLSHDIKTPLSAIKLYARALSKGLYTDEAKQIEIAESINAKADEIEEFVSRITKASREEFLHFEVDMGEFYLAELMEKISDYYREKLSLIKTCFVMNEFNNCLLQGDFDRSVEVLQNIMENAIKYGDGERIEIFVSEEEGCELVCIRNSGCSLDENELPHIFESFWRGSNAGASQGNGLGLYICRQLMYKMGGDIFAEISGDCMCVTAVFGKKLQ
ncbi:MAG: HAMP domain-containing histidine kinase [Lachnospiraceae bacterium]|nr:HAMP domain-containing histidine kinase [Lachnospiraceae bacterium]